MKFLYGIQATGNGHLTRSRVIINHLKSRGHEVDIIISGRKKHELWGTNDLKPYSVYKGLTYKTKKGKIQKLKTLRKLGIYRFFTDLKNIKNQNYDIIISDYEPLTAYLAKKWGIISIGIAHQYSFAFNIPKAGDNILNNFLMEKYAPVNISIGLHWHHFNQFILPPIIQKSNFSNIQEKPNQLMVYLPWEEKKIVERILIKIKDFTFLVYCNIKKEINFKNIKYIPLSRTTFLKNLKESEGIITNAGFETPSEALAMGKKILVKPLKGQFEQLSNAKALNQLKLATVVNKLNEKNIKKWCLSSDKKKIICNGVAEEIVKWIEKGDFDKTNQLKSKFWK